MEKKAAFGKYLRQLRENSSAEQKYVADRTGLGINTISSHENGHTFPQSRTRKLYAEAFGFASLPEFDAGWNGKKSGEKKKMTVALPMPTTQGDLIGGWLHREARRLGCATVEAAELLVHIANMMPPEKRQKIHQYLQAINEFGVGEQSLLQEGNSNG